jgi:hypothetical protein
MNALQLIANPELVAELTQQLIDAERRGFDRGWAACEAKYRRERDELGRRLDEAGAAVCEAVREGK